MVGWNIQEETDLSLQELTEAPRNKTEWKESRLSKSFAFQGPELKKITEQMYISFLQNVRSLAYFPWMLESLRKGHGGHKRSPGDLTAQEVTRRPDGTR